MARTEPERPLQLSVLDRLLDDAPEATIEPAASRAESIQALKDALRRDLEWLLNTRRTPDLAPESAPEVAASLHHFGLPDISSISRDASDAHARLARMVEEAIATFEPRLANIRVSIQASDRARFGELRFVIDGLLRLDPSPERVQFDTVLETARGLMEVGKVADA